MSNEEEEEPCDGEHEGDGDIYSDDCIVCTSREMNDLRARVKKAETLIALSEIADKLVTGTVETEQQLADEMGAVLENQIGHWSFKQPAMSGKCEICEEFIPSIGEKLCKGCHRESVEIVLAKWRESREGS